MTSVREAALAGRGGILANFREIPSICLPVLEEVLEGLEAAGLGGIIRRGDTSESVCEVPVEPNKIGLVLLGGLNPVCAAHETGIESENHCMSTVVDYRNLIKYTEI